MAKALEDRLYKAILEENLESVSILLTKGANPNKTTSYGRTCLGEAARKGNISIVKLLIDTSETSTKLDHSIYRKRHMKSHKRKIRHEGQYDETVVKCKNPSDRAFKDYCLDCETNETTEENKEKNLGYFVVVHSEGSSSDEGRIPGLPISPTSVSLSPQADLEWDEEIGNVAPTTSEDETWSSMYKWYAAILERTGAAIASAAMVTNGIDQQDAYMRTALHYATEYGHTIIVKLLIEAGCNIDIAASDGLIPLHVAVLKHYSEIGSMLILSGSNVNYKTHEKKTPLHFAASRGYIDLVKILVKHGSDLEARDTNDRTALYLAAARGHIHTVNFLISSGANVNGEEIHGYTPLCEAVWKGYDNIVEALLASGARITHSHKLLHYAIKHRSVKVLKILASIGGGINLHNENGDTPLLLSSRLGQPRMALILLENGANVNACNSITGANALHVAVQSVDCPGVFEDLLRCFQLYKIDMNAVALTGDTPLNRALLLERDEAAVLLIRYGADVNSCDVHSCGLDNLTIARRRNTNDLARMLIKAGHYVPLPDPSAKIPRPGCTEHWLYHTSKQPLSLSDLCRINIRYVGRNKVFFRYIKSLPLPSRLRGYLMLKDEGV